MERTPEPELMLEDEQARAYAEADFEEPNALFLRLLCERLPGLPEAGRAADLGCGPGDITLRFARRFSAWSVCGVDGSPAMLDWARRAQARAGRVGERVHFEVLRLPSPPPDARRFDLLFSNSLLHHLADSGDLWSTLLAWAAPGARVFVMDLVRPPDPVAARALVERYAGQEPERLRYDFYHSLRAAWRPDEVAEALRLHAGLAALRVELVSDRHMAVHGVIDPQPSQGLSS